jgi:hypothetical protein
MVQPLADRARPALTPISISSLVAVASLVVIGACSLRTVGKSQARRRNRLAISSPGDHRHRRGRKW